MTEGLNAKVENVTRSRSHDWRRWVRALWGEWDTSGQEQAGETALEGFAAWRQPVLWAAALCWAITAGIMTWQATAQLSADSPWILFFYEVGMILVAVTVTGFLALAAAGWRSMGSRRRVRSAWLLALVGPFLLYLVPARWFVDISNPDAMRLYSLVTSARSLALLGPSILGLFAGFLRAALILKRLRPESAAPGQIVLVVSPIYALVFALGMVVTAQAGGSLWMFLALTCFLFYPIVLLGATGGLLRPTDGREARELVSAIRVAVGMILALGFLFLALYFGQTDWWRQMIGWRGLVQVTFGLIGSVLLVTVALCDLVLEKTT